MEMLKDGLEILNPQVTEVIIHPRYVEASSSGFDIAVYKVASIYYVMDRQVQGVFKCIKNPIFGFFSHFFPKNKSGIFRCYDVF